MISKTINTLLLLTISVGSHVHAAQDRTATAGPDPGGANSGIVSGNNSSAAPLESTTGAGLADQQGATGHGNAGVILSAEQWEQGRSGDRIIQIPVINKLVNRWLDEPDKIIEIQYPGGEEGEFWVSELADWLVALGVPSEHLLISPGSRAGDIIQLKLNNTY